MIMRCKLSDLNCVLIGSLYSKLNWQSIVEAIKVCWPKNLLKTWAKFKPVTRHHSWQRGMSDFDMYILPLLCNQNEKKYYCWSSMIMSSYFNVFAPKNDKENDKDLCWYRPKPHFARGVSKLLEGSVYIFKLYLYVCMCIYIYIYIYKKCKKYDINYIYNIQPQIRKSWDSMENANKKRK